MAVAGAWVCLWINWAELLQLLLGALGGQWRGPGLTTQSSAGAGGSALVGGRVDKHHWQ